jgi:carbamoyl-phosphate synthase small subunit
MIASLSQAVLPARSASPVVRHLSLVLQDGTVFEGTSFGAHAPTAGEVVFNTGMVGYPESLSDPSYAGQILVFTYPLIGNYGVPERGRWESERVQVRGLVIAGYHGEEPRHWEAEQTLSTWLQESGVPAMSGVDTRRLTRHLRHQGVMLGKLLPDGADIAWYDPNEDDLVATVTSGVPTYSGAGDVTIGIYDCGAKRGMQEALLAEGACVVNIPYGHDPFVLPQPIDGLLISNGPGDPQQAKRAVEVAEQAMARRLPILGICLGNQILALAAGATVHKLKFGHRGQNQPTEDVLAGRCFITSQNHGFAVDETTLPDGWSPWMRNLNDGSNEGIRHHNGLWTAVQFHPEARPGPTDTAFILSDFVARVRDVKLHGSTAHETSSFKHTSPLDGSPSKTL